MSDDRPPLADAMRYAQAGMTLVAPMLLLGAVGYWLDRKFRTSPWLLLGGLLVGMGAGFVGFVRLVQEIPGGGRRS